MQVIKLTLMQALNVTSRHQEFSSLARKMPGCSPLTAWPPHLLTLLIWSPADTLQISSTPTEPVKWINPSPGATALTTMRMETTVCGMKLISRYGFESALLHLHKPRFFRHPSTPFSSFLACTLVSWGWMEFMQRGPVGVMILVFQEST